MHPTTVNTCQKFCPLSAVIQYNTNIRFVTETNVLTLSNNCNEIL